MIDLNFQIIWPVIIRWASINGLRILIIIIGGIIVFKIFKRITSQVVERTIKKTYTDKDKKGAEKRIQTLSNLFLVTGKILIVLTIILMVLPEFGINIGALLAGAGILGLAIGFGSQSLVKDIVTGLFILMEDQYRIGDWIRVVGFGFSIEGKVESISLRKTMIRGVDGVVHFAVHGMIRNVSNLTKGLSRIDVSVAISYDTDIDKAEKLINKIGEEMAKNPKLASLILSPPKFLGVEDIKGNQVLLKIIGETQPGKQWEVATALRKRIKAVFIQQKIELK